MDNNDNELQLEGIIRSVLTYEDARRLRRAIEEFGGTEQQLGKVLCCALLKETADSGCQFDGVCL